MEQLQVHFLIDTPLEPQFKPTISSYTSPAGTDYTYVTINLTFGATISTQMVTVSIFDDSVVEDTEFIDLGLSSVDSAVMLNPAAARINIEDVDSELTNRNCKFTLPL